MYFLCIYILLNLVCLGHTTRKHKVKTNLMCAAVLSVFFKTLWYIYIISKLFLTQMIYIYIHIYIHICYFEQFSLLIGNNSNLYFSVLWIDYILITVKIMLWITLICIFYFIYVYTYKYICVYAQIKCIWNKDMHTYIFSRFLKLWIFRLYPDYCYI